MEFKVIKRNGNAIVPDGMFKLCGMENAKLISMVQLNGGILLMPESYMDSVILHEMAHLKYLHHRKSFWNFLTILLGEDSNMQKVKMDIDMGIRYLYLDYILK